MLIIIFDKISLPNIPKTTSKNLPFKFHSQNCATIPLEVCKVSLNPQRIPFRPSCSSSSTSSEVNVVHYNDIKLASGIAKSKHGNRNVSSSIRLADPTIWISSKIERTNCYNIVDQIFWMVIQSWRNDLLALLYIEEKEGRNNVAIGYPISRTKARRLVPDIFVGNSKRSLVTRLCIGERWLRMTDSVSRKESFGETGETISKTEFSDV